MYVIIVKSLSSFNVRNFVLFVNFKQGMKSFFLKKIDFWQSRLHHTDMYTN